MKIFMNVTKFFEEEKRTEKSELRENSAERDSDKHQEYLDQQISKTLPTNKHFPRMLHNTMTTNYPIL